MSAVWLVQPRVKYIWVHLEPIRLKAHLVQAGPGRGRVFPSSSRPWPYCIPSALHVVSVKLHHLEWGHRQTLSLCPHTAHWKKVNTWQKLTELKWDHWLFSRKGVTTHPSDECLIELAELHYSTSSFLLSLQCFVLPFFFNWPDYDIRNIPNAGERSVSLDEAILSGTSGSAFRNLINWKGPPKAYPNSLLVLEVCPTVVKELLISRCKHLFLILDKDNARLKEKEFNQKFKFCHNLLTVNLFQTNFVALFIVHVTVNWNERFLSSKRCK